MAATAAFSRCFCSLPVILGQGHFLSPRGRLTMSGDLFGCHSSWWGCVGRRLLRYLVGREATDAAKYPTIHRTSPSLKNSLAPSTNSVRLRNPALHNEVRMFSLNNYLIPFLKLYPHFLQLHARSIFNMSGFLT